MSQELQCPHNRRASTCVFCDPVGRDNKDVTLSCSLCEKGFPIRPDGEHYGTQAKGMIPNRRCELLPPLPQPDVVEDEPPPCIWINNEDGYKMGVWSSIPCRADETEYARVSAEREVAITAMYQTLKFLRTVCAECDVAKADDVISTWEKLNQPPLK